MLLTDALEERPTVSPWLRKLQVCNLSLRVAAHSTKIVMVSAEVTIATHCAQLPRVMRDSLTELPF